jgi:cytochrome c oxidase cbb3-type subunit 2
VNNLFKFTIYVFTTLGVAWLAFVVGARAQFGDLTPTAEVLDEDGSIPQDADLFPHALPGIAQQGAKDYLALGCMTCHTQQVRMVEAGFDVERGWGNRPSVARDYILQKHVLIGNTRVGPDLANLGLRGHSLEWLHQHLFEPQALIPESVCQPSPFLYEEAQEEALGFIEVSSGDSASRFIKPTLRAERLVAYLQALKQNYELPEMAFVQTEDELDDSSVLVSETDSLTDQNASAGAPSWLAEQISSGKEIYMKAAPGGGLCFTCHQPNGQGLAGQFPPLAGSDWVMGDKEKLIKISLYGLMGPIQVNGVDYNGVMVPPGIPPGSLTDQQVADVLTYIRNDWGNSATAVTPNEVASVRANIKDRAPMQMWTAAELNAEQP